MSTFNRIFGAFFGIALLLFMPPGFAEEDAGEISQVATTPVLDSPELMFHFLAAEISAHQGDLEGSYEHYLKVAPESGDAEIAKRTTRIGMHLKVPEAVESAKLWSELAPEDIEAWQTLISLYLRDKNEDEAMEAAEKLIAAAKAQDKDGFIDVAAAAASSTDVESARVLIEAVSEKYRRDPKAQYALAVALFGMEQFDAAEAALRRTIALKKDDIRVWLLLSRLLETLDRPQEADEALQQGLTHITDSRLLRLAYAERLVASERYEGAYDIYSEMLAKDSQNEDLLQALGGLAVELERWQEARGFWLQLLDVHGKQDRSRYFLGEIERQTGDMEKSLEYFSRVNGLLRGDARVQMARIQAESGEIEEARETLSHQRLISPRQSVPLYLAEAELLDGAGQSEEAMRLYDGAVAEFPDSIELLYSRGMQAAKTGRVDLLERDMRTILEKEPDNAEAMNALGYTLADETDRYDEALILIRKALELMPESAAILDSMGWVLYRLGDFDEALKFLRMALEKNSDGEIAAHLGEVLWAKGERDQAVQVWDEALLRQPDSEHVQDTILRLKK